MRVCSKCKIPKYISSFNKDKREKFGHRYTCKACESEYNYLKDYGISHNDYLMMLHEQNNSCKICNKLDIFCQYKKLNIDHCHKTKKVRGLLCGECNKAIGLLKDDQSIALNVAKYLKESNG